MTDRIFDVNAHLAKEFGSEQISVINQRAEDRVLMLLGQLVEAVKDAPDMRIPQAAQEDSRMGWFLQTVGTMAAYLIAENKRAGVPESMSIQIFTMLLKVNVETALANPAILQKIHEAVAPTS